MKPSSSLKEVKSALGHKKVWISKVKQNKSKYWIKLIHLFYEKVKYLAHATNRFVI